MAVKDNANDWTIKEQIVEDLPTGLTFQFEKIEMDPSGPFRLRIFGESLPYGNREIIFSPDGTIEGGGTFMGGLCKPTWQTKIDE